MPNVWTHILFSQDVMNEIDTLTVEDSLLHYLYLGAQGPDPFFYHNFWPWQKDHRINDLGLTVHREKCGTVLMDMIDQAKEQNRQTKTYVIGFITHHVLDRVTHPYVHFKAGYNDYSHQKLETIIDTIMMKKYRDINTWEKPVSKMIDVGSSLDTDLKNMMEQMIQIHFGEQMTIEEGFLQKSYLDMKKALRIVYDPLGWKTKFLSSIMPPISHRPIKDDVDYLNESHEIWYHSATNESSEESFIDLYDRALIEAKRLIEAILDYWEERSQDSRKQVIDLLGDISYDTGKPLSEGLENKYAEPIV